MLKQSVDIKTLNGLMVKKAHSKGFTLIEVAIAVVLLATSLVVLLGLQSSVIDRTTRDDKKLRAILATRQILADAEIDPAAFEIQEVEKPLVEMLPSGDIQADHNEYISSLDGMMAKLRVEPWPYDQEPDALKKITLVISWGDTDADQLTTQLFIPK